MQYILQQCASSLGCQGKTSVKCTVKTVKRNNAITVLKFFKSELPKI